MEWIFSLLNFTGTYDWMVSVLQTDIAKMTVAFTIAAHLHRRWVKKDVEEMFSKIAASIDNVAATVSKDLQAGRERFERIENSVESLRKFVKFETPN